jgi:hypothetical protein
MPLLLQSHFGSSLTEVEVAIVVVVVFWAEIVVVDDGLDESVLF